MSHGQPLKQNMDGKMPTHKNSHNRSFKLPTFIQNSTPGQRITVIILTFIILAAVIYSTITLITRAGKIGVEVQYAPYNVEITLNGTKIKNRSTIYIEQGDYNLEVKSDHFETYTQTITIDSENNKIIGVLRATDDEGSQYAIDHAIEFTTVEGLLGIYLNEQGASIKKKYPILNHLPYNNSLYSLSYAYEDKNNNPIITVKAKDEVMDTAVAKLKDYASKEKDSLISYTIHFAGNTNPYLNPSTSTQEKPIDYISDIYYADGTNRVVNNGSEVGDYYVATIQDYNFDLDFYLAHYRVVLKKSNDTWELATLPQPYLTRNNSPNIPDEVLTTANSL